ncbi:hypothetical protein NCU17216 [Neurospora crassa OR74A]|uniref:Uncharacterized protein n=1 Tax=Neurospora crassa (strain ATCC 24698 / 74-OR23-1A / CBS 708.71 / DSM 1257 / FGSC 987) TaxID=367110 RepID=V5IMF3_NEUCR|nr:hypothetical protein NCU17216 [Neurospora crassa OR74A]ESA41911.1 hypothetical protein NCU17216 [Neurospora crassa OR74A]|eukprot:XP_011395365.1 hypothetical protein NCU17216 [Neurospora crassa OR74A]
MESFITTHTPSLINSRPCAFGRLVPAAADEVYAIVAGWLFVLLARVVAREQSQCERGEEVRLEIGAVKDSLFSSQRSKSTGLQGAQNVSGVIIGTGDAPQAS